MRDARVLLPHPFEPRIVVQPSWKDRDKSSKREKDEDGYEKEIFDSVTYIEIVVPSGNQVFVVFHSVIIMLQSTLFLKRMV